VSQRATYLFAGGGTGGHLFPGMAVAEELLARNADAQILFVGSEREIEREIVARAGYEHRTLDVEPSTEFRRHPLRFLWRTWQAVRMAKAFLADLKPRAVIGLGGFASVPIVQAAYSKRIPVVLLEQNIVAGRATRWLARRANKLCLSFDETVGIQSNRASVVVTGNPVRQAIIKITRESSTKPTLLVLGGSQGSEAVNQAMLDCAATLQTVLDDWQIIHQTGPQQLDDVRATYARLGLNARVYSFMSDLVDAYSEASLVVSRAGATTLAELACVGIPAILIPYPQAIGDHQVLNARAFEEAGAAIIVEQNPDTMLTGANLSHVFEDLLNRTSRLEQMGVAMQILATSEAAGRIVDAIEEVSHQR
jgi:UDP-N-acetylglucosamine--N-acetylmuramyl-(pentapeptide) pyrophosphoryl-undecaprenol N-acetylglucosamine transferase